MLADQSIIGIIPARGGSKGLPRKNLKMLAGKPLIAWTIEAARQSLYLDRVILSSEDAEIIEVAKKWQCEVPFVRPAKLAGDDTTGIEPVLHAIGAIVEHYDYLVLLQPTSPLRSTCDIDDCIHYCISQGAPVCVSVSEVNKSPYWMYTLDEDKKLSPLFPTDRSHMCRQNLPSAYIPNGAIYIARTDYLLREKGFITKETLAFTMPAERSVDIDNELDLLLCSLLLTSS